METYWLLDTHGDPLGGVRRLLLGLWERMDFDALLVPVNGSEDILPGPSLLEDKAQLRQVTPFKPLMVSNAAGKVPDLVSGRPHDRFGLVLRPCEVRTLIEMVKHDSLHLDNVTTIGVDCLGTFPMDEFQWRAQRKGSTEKLARDSLKFARQGGIVAYRYRSACQHCDRPHAAQADVNIGVLGMPVRQHILVSTPETETAARLGLPHITDRPAEESTLAQREKTLAKLTQRHRRTRERLIESLGDLIPDEFNALIQHFEGCGDCQACIQACPICAIKRPRRGEDGKYQETHLIRWLISCSGCGICEQACPNHKPLSAMFSHLRDQLASSYQYVPGRSMREPLPSL
jgi:formate dehydrogenase subunit beta